MAWERPGVGAHVALNDTGGRGNAPLNKSSVSPREMRFGNCVLTM